MEHPVVTQVEGAHVADRHIADLLTRGPDARACVAVTSPQHQLVP